MNKVFMNINKLIVGSGFINAILFNYNINNVDIIRNNVITKLLISERLMFSFYAVLIGPFKLPLYIDYMYIKLLKENPENYGYRMFPEKKINYFDIIKNL